MAELIAILDKTGLVGVLIFILYTGAREWWVFGRQYRSLLQERDEWKRLALRGIRLLEAAADEYETDK